MSAGVVRRAEAMGTVVSLRMERHDRVGADRFFSNVARMEAALSRFVPTSDISRLACGDITLEDAAVETRSVIAVCEMLAERTDGAFCHRHRTRGLDVNAVAKGWIAAEAATALLLERGWVSVNAGGDVLCSTRRTPWRIGIQHHEQRLAVLAVLELDGGAVATSGAYERGTHIESSGSLVSVSVLGPDLAVADGLSTAVFAAGRAVPPWWDRFGEHYSLLSVTNDGLMRWEQGPDAHRLVQPRSA